MKYEICLYSAYFFVFLNFELSLLDNEEKPEIWLLDFSLQWHYLACNFRHYYRMLITHLGIRGWQYLYTQFGLSPEVKVKIRLIIDLLTYAA